MFRRVSAAITLRVTISASIAGMSPRFCANDSLQHTKPQEAPQVGGCPLLTTTAGAPWINNNDALTAGERGPVLMQDYQLLEKLAHQNRERVPERTVHAKGWGAYGTLRITHDISKYTCAKCLQVGKETPMIARFSTVSGERGAADLERDVRGFSLKFYTEEGNWDMVGNNTPVFFVRDPTKFTDFIHVLKRHPQTHLRSPTALWDFWSLSPESLHQISITMSDRGIPKSLTTQNGYGSHTYSMWTETGERHWVKFHFKTMQGIENISNAEAEKITGRSRDTYGEDLYNRIESGNFPKWKFQIQVMAEKDAEKVKGFNPFDLTKVWPHKDYPMIDVGEFELNRLPNNYFAEIEQLAFAPSNIVPGIGFSPDKMLQARVFAYADTHRYRLGVNYEHLPVNRPQCPMANYHRDGLMNTIGGLASGNPNAFYEPNSFGGPVEGGKRVQEPPLRVSGDATYYSHRGEEWDDYSQVNAFYTKVLDAGARDRLHNNLGTSLADVPKDIVERALSHLKRVHPDYEAGVRKIWEKREANPDKYEPNGLPVTRDTPHGYKVKDGEPLGLQQSSTLDQLASYEGRQPLHANH